MYRFQRWRDALSIAPDAITVERLMRDYSASIAPELVGTLPNDCQRALVSIRDGGSDVQTVAVTLLHVELSVRGDGEASKLLHELAHTFASASVRISRLRAEMPSRAAE